MSKSSDYAILVRAEEQERQALAEREQDFFNTRYSKDRLAKVKEKHELTDANQTPKTAERQQQNGNNN